MGVLHRAHCIALCKGILHRAMPLADCGKVALHRVSYGHRMGMSHLTSHGTMPRACTGRCMGKWHGEVVWSFAREHCTGALHGNIAQHCVGTLHRAGKRGSPTTDPIPIPAPAQPQVRIIPAETGNARVPVRLSCHIWGFYPPEVTVIWLHNGDIVEPDDYNPISAIPNGNWSYQTQVSVLVAPVAGDTYTCSVQHVSLQEPLLEDWSDTQEMPLPDSIFLYKTLFDTVLLLLGLGYIYSRGRNKVPPQAAHAQHQVQSKDQPQIRRQRWPALAGSTR
uniref:Ig-like domain-containing protein n=1 Tax=Anas platyrhynchos TaxID=8839 RepID=A0A8B9SJW3_ANAPL